jgi:hypothetical protein
MAGKSQWLARASGHLFQTTSFRPRTHIKKNNVLSNGWR